MLPLCSWFHSFILKNADLFWLLSSLFNIDEKIRVQRTKDFGSKAVFFVLFCCDRRHCAVLTQHLYSIVNKENYIKVTFLFVFWIWIFYMVEFLHSKTQKAPPGSALGVVKNYNKWHYREQIKYLKYWKTVGVKLKRSEIDKKILCGCKHQRNKVRSRNVCIAIIHSFFPL